MFVVAGEGGELFEIFLFMAAPERQKAKFIQLQKKCATEIRFANAQEAAYLTGQQGVSFYFHVLSLLANRGRAVIRQLFFIDLVLCARGLSRTGLSFVQGMNLSLPPRTYDGELALQCVRTVAQNKRS